MVKLYHWYSRVIVLGSVLLLFGVFWEIANEAEADYAQEILGLVVALAGIGSFWRGSIDTLKRLFKGVNVKVNTQDPKIDDIPMRTRQRLANCIIKGDMDLISLSATNKTDKRLLERASRRIQKKLEYVYKIYPYILMPVEHRQLQADHLVEIFLQLVRGIFKPGIERNELTVDINFPVAQRIIRTNPTYCARHFKFQVPVSAVADDFFGMVPYGASIPLKKAPASFIVKTIIPALLVQLELDELRADNFSGAKAPITSWCRLDNWYFSLRNSIPTCV